MYVEFERLRALWCLTIYRETSLKEEKAQEKNTVDTEADWSNGRCLLRSAGK